MDKSFLIFLAIPIFFIMILIEYAYGKLKGKNNYRLNDTITSINIGLLSRFPTILNLGVQGLVYAYVASYLSLNILPENSIFTWVFAFVLYDFLYYWMHRLHHENKLLWGTHVVHHHGEEFNLSTAMRQTSTGFLWKWIFYTPMMLIGVPGEVFVTVAGINLVYQFWVHTEHIGHLGFLEKIFITPMNHRIHHAKNKEYIDANYGGVFVIWDRMFGTYTPQREDLKPVYGTATPLNSWNPIWANFQVFSIMLKDTIRTKSLKDKFKVWFSETYWRPADCVEEKDPKDFYKKFNPRISADIKLFSITQILFTTTVFNLVFLNAQLHSYYEIILFGISLIALASLTGFLMHGKRIAYQLILMFSVISLIALYFYNPLNISLISTKLLLAQLSCNVLIITGILLSQSLSIFKVLKT